MSIKSMTGINMGRGKVNMLHIYKVIMKQGILSEYFNLPTFFRFLLKFLFFRKVLVFKKSPPSYKWGFQLCSAQKETYLLKKKKNEEKFSSVQRLSRVWLFATPWIAALQASLSITNSRSSLRLTSIESVMLSSHLILCRPLLLLPPIPPILLSLPWEYIFLIFFAYSLSLGSDDSLGTQPTLHKSPWPWNVDRHYTLMLIVDSGLFN